MKQKFARNLVDYIRSNKIFSAVASYFFVSALIKLFSGVNICIPCMWKTLFGFECPGCGMTSAFIQFIQLDLSGAYRTNPLLFIVMPVGLFYVISDYQKFIQKSN